MKFLLGSLFCIFFNLTNLSSQTPTWIEMPLNSSSKIIDLAVDSFGFLWTLSPDGLNKFDGLSLEKILLPSPNDQFTSFFLSKENKFYIGEQKGTLIKYNPTKKNKETYCQLGDLFSITGIDGTKDNNRFLAISYGRGVYIRINNIDSILTTENSPLLSQEIYNGHFYENKIILSTDQGLQILTTNGKEFLSEVYNNDSGLSDIIVTQVLQHENDLWICNFDNTVDCIKADGSILSFHFESASKITQMKLLHNKIYVAREDGLYVLNENIFKKIYPLGVLRFDLDREGNLWLIDLKNNLIKGNILFQKYNHVLNSVQALAFINEHLWLGTKDGLFSITNGVTSNLLMQNITCLATEKELVWVGTYSNGIFILNKDGKIIDNIKTWGGFSNQSILYITCSNHTVYVSSLTGVISMDFTAEKDHINVKKITSLNKMIGEGYVYQILKDNEKLFFATEKQGVKMWYNDHLTNFNTYEDGKKVGSVYSMTFGKDGRLWFSSSDHGLNYIKNDKVINENIEKSNKDYYTSLITLSGGDLLMIRSQSVDLFNPTSGHLVSYDKEIGLDDKPPFLNTFVSKKGQIFFAHDQKIYSFDQLDELKTTSNVLIDHVLVNLDTILNQNSFKQDENNIQFHFNASWLTDPEKISYQYRLDSFDEKWRTTKDRTVSYPKLNPGKYTFQIRASQSNQFEGNEITSFEFSIHKYFYNTTWFVGGTIIIFLIGIAWFWNYRKKQQYNKSIIERKHIESQLTSLKNQLNPHFLFNSFNTLIGLIEENPTKSITFAENLTDFYRLVLEHGKLELVPFSEELKLVKLYIEIMNDRFENAIHLTVPDKNILSKVPPLTLQLLIENAVKHNEVGKNKPLYITVNEGLDYISVVNNSTPKKYPSKSSGSGLENIQKRYLLLNPKPIKVSKNQEYFEVLLPII